MSKFFHPSYIYAVRQHPIKANPVKAGYAKPWVYRHTKSDHDRQAAEDHKTFFRLACQPFEVLFRQPAPTNAGSQTIRSTAILRNFKVLLFALVIFAVAGSAYAFAAQNTVEDSAAGYKASVVPGYSVTGIVYDLNTTDPTIVDAITFSISPTSGSAAAAIVKIQTVTAGSWTDCSLVAAVSPAMDVTCTFGSLAIEDVTALNIVASSTTDP